MGLRVLTADSGESALAVCQFDPPDLILSDWMMPGMDGLEFCRLFRENSGDRYSYFILLTSKAEKTEIAEGLDAGADDFLTKPVNADELRARIRAGQRVVHMERQLQAKNGVITAALDEMKRLHARIDSDLQEAQSLQQSLVRDRFRRVGSMDISLFLRPAGRVGGDLVGVFDVNEAEIGIFALDVSGHGIASALMTARLAACFASSQASQNIAIRIGADGRPTMRPPAEAARILNEQLLSEIETDQYLTLILARLEVATGRLTLVQAGHPHPMLLRASGEIEKIGKGGLPVGMLAGAEYDEVEVTLRPGERLFLGSDGITECMDPQGTELGDAGLAGMLKRYSDARGEPLFDAIVTDLTAYCGTGDFSDDISAAVIDYRTEKN